MKLLSIFGLIFSLLVVPSAKADLNEGDVRIGLTGGHVGLLYDVGDQHNNALGFGGFANFSVTNEFQFELGYLGSTHNNLQHQEISAGVNIFFNSYDAAYFAALAGVDFVGHSLGGNIGQNSSGMAIYGGLGVDFELNKHFSAGLYGKYHKAFDTTVNVNGTNYKAIQDWITVLVRMAYIIPNS